MATRRPLVLVGGRLSELPAADMLPVKAAQVSDATAVGQAVMTAADAAAARSAIGAQAELASLGFRNLLINGSFSVDQYGITLNTATAVSTGKAYFTDRWNTQCTKLFKLQVRDDAPQFLRYLRVTQNAGAIAMAAADYAMVSQIVEVSGNLAYLRWGWNTAAKPLTLSFWARCSVAGAFGLTVRLYTGSKYLIYPTTFTIAAANTWERQTITVAAPTPAMAGSAGIGDYLEVDFDLGSGTTYQTATASTWLDTGASSYRRVAASTNLMARSTWNLDFTEVQLEEGDKATPFERRPITLERQLCERYYQCVYVGKVVAVIYTPNGDTRAEGINLPTPMRVSPSIFPASVVNHSINFTASAEGVNAPTVTITPAVLSSNGRQFLYLSQNGTTTYPIGNVAVAGMHCDTLFRLSAEM